MYTFSENEFVLLKSVLEHVQCIEMYMDYPCSKCCM